MNVSHHGITPDWPAPARVRSLITTRTGGVSTGPYADFNLGLNSGDDPDAVHANRRRLRVQLPQEPKWLRQIHGASAVDADHCGTLPEADGSVARVAETVCAVLVADCLPVLLCDRAGTVIAVAHAGWRGMNAGIIENTVHEMRTPPQEILAYFGPAIGPTAFEVGSDVRDAFVAADSTCVEAFRAYRDGKWLADLFRLARLRLARCGVEQIFGGGICTYNDPARFFSHRRDRVSGRMAALIWLAT